MSRKLKFITIFFVAVGALSFCRIRIRSSVGDTGVVSISDSIVYDIEQKFEQILDQTIGKFTAFQELPDKFKPAIKDAHYGDKEVLILTRNDDGIKLNLGKAGHGDVGPYLPTKGEVVVTGLLEGWKAPLNDLLQRSVLKDFVNFPAAQVAFFKFILLSKDRYEKLLSIDEYLLGLSVICYKLMQTPGFTSFGDYVSKVAEPIRNLVNSITIGTKTAVDYLDGHLVKVRKIMFREFSKTASDGRIVPNSKYVPNGSSLTEKQAMDVAYALVIKSYFFYLILKESYERTPAGIAAAKKIKNVSLKSKFAAIVKYNKNLPGFVDLNKFIAIELARVFLRLSNNKYQNIIMSKVDPILQSIGVTANQLLDLVDPPQPEPPAGNELLSLDGDFDGADVTAF